MGGMDSWGAAAAIPVRILSARIFAPGVFAPGMLAALLTPGMRSFPRAGGIRNHDRRVVLQLFEAAIGDDVSRIDTFDLGEPVIGHSRFDLVDVRDVIFEHIDEGSLAILLNRG